LQIVASLTAERDGDIRKAALNALATGYKILGMVYPVQIYLHGTYKNFVPSPFYYFSEVETEIYLEEGISASFS
jgi:hypothetical protein